ncbi:MAG: hypothetical protein KA488_05060 [Flavobacterium sp.]|jgi:hypothetical protein|nr:hypothetical protein [Flavobacterium sp.]MBP6099974.1 hypothetical protein [Flavobacterium sp.]
MKTLKIVSLSALLGLAIACGSSQSNVAATSPPPPPPAPTVAVEKPDNGVHEPTQKEYLAIQEKYINVSLDQLKEGYKIYSQGACINCHEAKNIYKRSDEKWGHILDDMAEKARLSDSEKDAVTKYVFAIKAGQSK